MQPQPLRGESLPRFSVLEVGGITSSFCSCSCGKLTRLLLQPVSHFLPDNLQSLLPRPAQFRSFRRLQGEHPGFDSSEMDPPPGRSARVLQQRLSVGFKVLCFFLSFLNNSRKETSVEGAVSAGFIYDSWKFLK